MSIDRIKEKILSDAKLEASAIVGQARSRADDILHNANERGISLVAKAKQDGEEEKQRVIQRMKAVAQIDARKVLLVDKQALIEEAFDQARNEILELDEESYLDLMAKKIVETGLLKGELLLNDKDRANRGQKILDRVKSLAPDSELKISDEDRDLIGGFMIRSGEIYINGTMRNMISEAKEEITSQVAALLFR